MAQRVMAQKVMAQRVTARDFCRVVDDDQELTKEIAITDRMCPCAARWSMIAIVIYSCMWAVNDRHRDMLCCAVLCSATLCYAMLCYAMIYKGAAVMSNTTNIAEPRIA